MQSNANSVHVVASFVRILVYLGQPVLIMLLGTIQYVLRQLMSENSDGFELERADKAAVFFIDRGYWFVNLSVLTVDSYTVS